MKTINPYLNFNGNCEEAFTFYKSVFGTDFIVIQRFKDLPPEVPSPVGSDENIMHVSLPVGKQNILMGCDVPAAMGRTTIGNNFHVSISTESEEETTMLFTALSTGGKITMPLDKTFWGSYFGMCTDKFGIQWMVNYDYNAM